MSLATSYVTALPLPDGAHKSRHRVPDQLPRGPQVIRITNKVWKPFLWSHLFRKQGEGVFYIYFNAVFKFFFGSPGRRWGGRWCANGNNLSRKPEATWDLVLLPTAMVTSTRLSPCLAPCSGLSHAASIPEASVAKWGFTVAWNCPSYICWVVSAKIQEEERVTCVANSGHASHPCSLKTITVADFGFHWSPCRKSLDQRTPESSSSSVMVASVKASVSQEFWA